MYGSLIVTKVSFFIFSSIVSFFTLYMLIHKKFPYESIAKNDAGISFYFVNFKSILVDNILFGFYFYLSCFTETI